MLTSDEKLPRTFRHAMVLAALLTPFGSTMIAVALPGIGRELGAGAAQMNLWLVMSYLLVAIVGQSPGGMLGDRIGHARALGAGVALHAAGSILGSTVTGLAGLATARVLMAAGGAIVIPAVMALLRNETPEDRRARAFGLFGGAMGLAAALGPVAGGWLVEAYGWRAIFACNLPVIAAVISMLGPRALRRETGREAAPRRHRPDVIGAALLGLGLAPVVLAATPSSGLGAGTLMVGLTVLALFAAWERRALDPVLDPGLLRKREFVAGGSLIALQNLAMYGLLFLIPAALGRAAAEGAAPGRPEGLLFGMLAGMVVSPPLGGRVAERAGARVTALGGSLLTLGGLGLIGDLGTLAHPSRVMLGLVLLGTGLGLASAPAQAAAMSSVAAGEAGAAAGALSTMRYLGGLGGIALLNARPGPGAPMRAYLAVFLAAAALSLCLPGRSARWGPALLARRGGGGIDPEVPSRVSRPGAGC